MSYLSVTDADREAMLATIGVATVDELFRDIPAGVRYRRELDVLPALSEAELQRHFEELAGKNVVDEICFLGAGIYDHHVPAVVDAVLQRGELLTAYTPYQPEMSQGILQAIFEYQTAICELTGMDVSNASGYDGTTVAADACFVAKHATGRTKVVVTEATNPQVRQVVKTYAPGFGLEIVEVPHTDGTTSPDDVRRAATDAACVIFQQPNFFGGLEPAPDLAAAASDAEAVPVAHVDLLSLGVLEAPGAYGCGMAIGEGQSAGNYQSFAGPHYGFLAARSEFTRRLPGRIVGETIDAAGERGYVLTLQTREQHIRREKATSNITTNQTLLALAGLVYLSWLGPQGLRELGETCLALAEHAKGRLRDAGFDPLGSCTMKYNPRVNERLVGLPGFRDLHPLQEPEGAQGALELEWRLQEILAEVTGLDAVSLQPAAGSQGELTGLMLFRAYFRDRGEDGQRRKVVIPDTAHGTNPASVTMAGYELTHVKTDARGNIDVDDLRTKVDTGTAGLMLTNPSTLGLFDENIEEIENIFHGVGALMYYDGANLNAVCGISRPGDMGFDIVHINLHKTFSQPHGGGGPGGGPIAVRDVLEPFLPVPVVVRDGEAYALDFNRPKSIGTVRG